MGRIRLDAALREGVGFAVHRQRHIQQRHRRHRAGTLAEAHVRRDERPLAEGFQYQCARGLCRNVAREHRTRSVRTQPRGAQRRHGAGKPVQQHRDAVQRRAKADAAESREIEAAHLGQHVHRVPRGGAVGRDAPPDDLDLPLQRLVRKSRAAARHVLHRASQQYAGHRRGGGGVADAHFARCEQPRPTRRFIAYQLHADADCPLRLFAGHGGAVGKIRRTVADAAIQYAVAAVKVRDAHVHRHDAAMRDLRHAAHSRAPQRQLTRNGGGHAAFQSQLVGEELAPGLESAMDFAGGIVDSLAQLDEGTFSALVSGLEVIAFAGPGLLTAGGAIRLIGAVIGGQAAAIGMGAIAVTALGWALNDLANTQFKGQFGTNELDISEVETYVSNLHEQFTSAREEIDECKRLLEEAEKAYEDTSRTLSSKLISKTVTGNALTEEDKSQFIQWGQELGDSLKQGMENSLAGTYSSLSQTFGIGTEDQTVSADMWASIVDILNEDYEAQKAKLEELSKGLVEAMTSAFADDSVTSEELEKIQSYIDQMNEIYANELKATHAKQQAEIIAKSQALGWDAAQEALDMVQEETNNELITLKGEQAYNRQKLINAGATDEQLEAFDRSAQAQLDIQEATSAGFMINTFESLLRGSDMSDTFTAIQNFADSVMANGGIVTQDAISQLTGNVSAEDAAKVVSGIGDLADRMGGYDHMEALYRTLAGRSDEESQDTAAMIGNALAIVQAANVLAMNSTPTSENIAPVAETTDHGLSQVAALAEGLRGGEGVDLKEFLGWSDIDLATAGLSGQLEGLAQVNLGVPNVQEYFAALSNPEYAWPAPKEGEPQGETIHEATVAPSEMEPEVVGKDAIATVSDQTVNVDLQADSGQVVDAIHEADGEEVTANVTANFDYMEKPDIEMDPIPMSIQPVIDGEVSGQDALSSVEGESVSVQVEGDTTQLEGAISASDAQQLIEMVNGDNTELNASIWSLDGQQITTIVDGDTSQAQQAIQALGNQTIYVNVVARTVGAPLAGYAEGGRADTPSLFGEAGPEWAIPEEHTENTRKLLAKATEAAGFSLLDLAGGSKSSGSSSLSASDDECSSMTIVYSPTINASNVDGVEKALGDDKKAFVKYMKEKLMFDKMEVYA